MTKPRPSREVGERIRARREDLGWTRAELAARTGVTPAQVGRWEVGYANPQGAVRTRVIALLGLRETWLLTGRGPKLIESIGTGDGTVGDP